MSVVIIPRERTPTPAEAADIEAKERFDDEASREIFRAGARWERGEDSAEWPFSFFQTLLFLVILVQVIAFFCGMVASDCRLSRNWRGTPQYENCEFRSKWNYIFPAYIAGGYASDFMRRPLNESERN